MGVYWGDIRDALSADIAAGILKPGDRLPTEPELCRRFETGRHSVRRAISALSLEGKLRAEQGRGTFVEEAALIDYTIGKRTRRTTNFAQNGVSAGGKVLASEVMAAPLDLAQRLSIAPGQPVLAVTRLTEADGAPIAYGTVYRCAARFPDFLARQAELGSVTKTYASYGLTDYFRGSTNIVARLSKPDEARHLRQHPDQPVMVVRAVDVDPDGQPISYSKVVWAAMRVSFNLDTGAPF